MVRLGAAVVAPHPTEVDGSIRTRHGAVGIGVHLLPAVEQRFLDQSPPRAGIGIVHIVNPITAAGVAIPVCEDQSVVGFKEELGIGDL